MLAQTILAFALPILTGIAFGHVVWREANDVSGIIFASSLGMGLGLGISSLLYFSYLLFFAGQPYFVYVELLFFLIVLFSFLVKRKGTPRRTLPRPLFNRVQVVILFVTGIVLILSISVVVAYIRNRAVGDWDAWMIYNRSARFIYRSGEFWRDAFSEEIATIFHADYPPLVSLNIASRWDILNEETSFVPMMQSALFAAATMGLLFGALANLKSIGQAGIGVVLLTCFPFFLNESGRQLADVPFAFYTLSAVVLSTFYRSSKQQSLTALAGFAAGLAAWTKNEGILFLLVLSVVLTVVGIKEKGRRDLIFFGLGAAIPTLILLYFKFYVAPPSEFIGNGILQKAMDLPRHREILSSFANYFLFKGGWNGVGAFLIVCVYGALFYDRANKDARAAIITPAVLVLQFAGYYAIYLISPYDLKWHIDYSINRLFVGAYPLLLFAVLNVNVIPESVFASRREAEGVK